jgi:hypothetical protein
MSPAGKIIGTVLPLGGIHEPPVSGDLNEVRNTVRQLCRGRSNATSGSWRVLTLAVAPATTTTITYPGPIGIIGPNSTISLCPMTAHAAADIPTLWFSVIGKNTFTVTHSANAFTDRTFRWSVQG